jgi:hypothetical protein
MGLAMVAMALFGVRAGWLQAAFFTAAALWFALLAVATAGRGSNLHHALMAGAMAWMTAGHGHHTGGLSVLVAVYCCLATAVWVTASRRADRPAAAVGHALMTAGMAAMLLLPQPPSMTRAISLATAASWSVVSGGSAPLSSPTK